MTNKITRRAITVTITLGGGKDGEREIGQYKLEGGRVECAISSYNVYSMGALQCRIYGLPLSDIKKLTVAGTLLHERFAKNRIQIDAGDEGEELTTIFRGNIYTAYGNFQEAPEVSLEVVAITLGAQQVKPAKNYSTKGALPASAIFKHLANEAGIGYVNEGVDAVLPIQYLTGSITQQIRQVAQAADVHFVIEPGSEILYTWPKGSARTGYMPTVGPGNKLVGYPVFSSQAINIRTEFLPNVLLGGKIKLAGDTLGDMINREWKISQVTHELAAQVPNGPWFTSLGLYVQD